MSMLDNLDKIKEIDKQDMLGIVENFPEHLEIALDLAKKAVFPKKKKFKNIVVCGMGGSAIAADIVKDAFDQEISVPYFVNRNYTIPNFVDKDTLFISISYSGNTEETLTATKAAIKNKAKVICLTSGGKIAALGETALLVPAGFQPRAALPYLLVMLVMVLEKMGIIGEVSSKVEEAVKVLKKSKADYNVSISTRSNQVKQLANKLVGKMPIIFAVSGFSSAAGIRLKTQMSENAKTTALLNFFPELNHNEIVSLGALKRTEHNFVLIILRDEKDLEKIKKNMEIVKSLIGMQMGGTQEITSQGKHALSRILSLIYFGDLLTVYLALLKGIDPTPVDVITKLKKEMQR